MTNDVESSLRAQTLEWLANHDWLGGSCTEAKVNKWRFCELALLMYPGMPSSTLCQASLWNHLVATMDDQCEGNEQRTQQLRGLLLDDLPVDSLARGWRDLCRQIARGSNPWAQILQRAMARILDAYDWENRLRATEQIPPMREYETWRYLSGGIEVYGVIAATAVGLTTVDFESELAQKLVQAAGTVACMTNDIMSVPWDEATRNPINAARIAIHANETSEAWISTWQNLFETLTVIEGRPALAAFASTLRSFSDGTRDWMHLTLRYS